MSGNIMKKAVLLSVLALVGCSSAWAQTGSHDQREQGAMDLRQEIASPLEGQFAVPGESIRSGEQQDFGGISGNANGYDGMSTATGERSAYPSPDAGTYSSPDSSMPPSGGTNTPPSGGTSGGTNTPPSGGTMP